ncbi:HGGxSTG domain-containing protein [Pseudomonas sp.]
MPHGQLPSLPFPPEFHGLCCGAKTRAGTPCKRRDLYDSGRCRLHGGLSTGPKRKRTP